MTRSTTPLLLLLLSTLAGCTTTATRRSQREIRNTADQLAQARDEIQAGQLQTAIRRLVDVRLTEQLLPEVRTTTERLLEQTLETIFDQYATQGATSDDYDDLFDLALPDPIRARAGLLAAEALFAEDHQVLAFEKVREVDRELPLHASRGQAGEVLGRIGLWLIREPGNYRLVFSYRARGVTALEYLVIQHPLSGACAEAYYELSRYYEDVGDYEYAIQNLEDMLVYHPGSPLVIESEAKLPELRMQGVNRDDYDRHDLILSQRAIERWLGRYPDHELRGSMLELELDCSERIARSDMIIAKYYHRVNSDFGARIHANRALDLAQEMGLEGTAREARDLLALLPAPAEAPLTVEPLSEDSSR